MKTRGRPKLGKPGTYQEQGSVLFLKNQEPTNNRNLLVLQETYWFTRKLKFLPKLITSNQNQEPCSW